MTSPFLDVLETGQTDGALGAGAHFGDFILVAAQGFDVAVLR